MSVRKETVKDGGGGGGGGLLEKLNVHIHILGEGRMVKKSDLTNPSPEFAQEVVFKFLIEFGYSENFMDTRRALTMLPDVSQQDATDCNLELIILAAAARRFFQQIDLHEPVFGLFDLTCPTGPRLKTFLMNMCNFWIFANMRYSDLEPIQKRVEDKARKSKILINEVKFKQNKLSTLTHEREQLKIENQKAVEKIEQLEEDLKKGSEDLTVVLKQLSKVKDDIKELDKQEKELDLKIHELESDSKHVEEVMRSVELKKDLENDLLSAKNEHSFKEIELQKQGRELQEYKRKVEEFSKFLQELNVISTLVERIKGDQQSLEQKRLENGDLRERLASENKEIEQLHLELRTVQTQQASKLSQWTEKKNCLEREIEEYNRELENHRQRMTEEEIVASSLEKEITIATKNVETSKEEIEKVVNYYRSQIALVIEGYKRFEQEAEDICDQIENSMKRVAARK